MRKMGKLPKIRTLPVSKVRGAQNAEFPQNEHPNGTKVRLSFLGGPQTASPVIRIAPEPICPNSNWKGVAWVDTLDLLFRGNSL